MERPESKFMPCRACGKPMRVTYGTKKAPRCVECGIDALVTSIKNMASHSGPYYERWLAAGGNTGRGLTGGHPPDVSPDQQE